MNHFTIIAHSLGSGTADTNRLLAYLHGFSTMGVKVDVFFVLPNKDFIRHKSPYKGITYYYCWSALIKQRILKYVPILIYLKLLILRLERGSVVFIYGIPELLHMFLSSHKFKLFHERTENPEIVNFGIPLYKSTLAEYFIDCQSLDGLFVISKSLKDYFIDKGINPFKIFVINVIVDSDRFDRIVRQELEYKYVAYCGSASNNKDGVDQLIRSFSIVLERHPKLVLFIIGNIPTKKEDAGNIQLIKDLGIGNNVVLTGHISAEQIPQLLKNATILALDRPNNIQAKYGFPTKLGEYLLTENPVVVTKVGDISLFLRDKESALLAEPNDSQNFADKIEWILSHPEESKVIGVNGRTVAMKYFNYITETTKIFEILFYQR